MKIQNDTKEILKFYPKHYQAISDTDLEYYIPVLKPRVFLCRTLTEAKQHINAIMEEPQGSRFQDTLFLVFSNTLNSKRTEKFITRQSRRFFSRGITVKSFQDKISLEPTETEIAQILLTIMLICKETQIKFKEEGKLKHG